MKKNFKNYLYRPDYPLILVVIPCTLWTAVGLGLCYFSSMGISGTLAVLFPPFVILTSFILARRYRLLGGLTLLFEGFLLLSICLEYLTVSENIIFLTVFVLPLVFSGFIFIISNSKPKLLHIDIMR